MGLAHKLHVIGNLISDDDTIAMIKNSNFKDSEHIVLAIDFKIENLKYVKLLKIIEITVIIISCIAFISLKIPIILLSLIYFIILIYDFYKKKIDIKNFIINFIFLFVDFYVMYLAIKIISQKLPNF